MKEKNDDKKRQDMEMNREDGTNRFPTTNPVPHRQWNWLPRARMIMPPRIRKFALTAHITSSVGWLGAVIVFLAHAVAGLVSKDAQITRAAYLMMEVTGWFVLVPLSFASLLTGIVQSLGTAWGLFRHYWVTVKLLITVFATAVLLTYMRALDSLACAAAKTTFSTAELGGHHCAASPVVHASTALVLLFVCVVLSVYKPWGRTRYGQRRQNEQRIS